MTTPDELERLAAEAKPGPWDYTMGASGQPCVEDEHGRVVASYLSAEDAAFIAAANPATILALLSERAELLATVERMRGALEEAADSFARIKDYVGGRNIDFASAFVRADRGEKHARAALTTGEEK